MKNETIGEEPDDCQDNIWVEMFAAVDQSDDGILSREELWHFIKSIKCPLMQSMTKEEFEKQVYSRCLGEDRGPLHDVFNREDFIEFMEEYAMKIFFVEADLDGDGIVTFEEIITACAKTGLNLGYPEIGAIKMLFDLENDSWESLLSHSEITEKLKECDFTPSMANMPGNEEGNVQRALGKLRKKVFKGKDSKFFINAIKFMESHQRTATKRWKPFINFQREVQGRMVMPARTGSWRTSCRVSAS